MMWLLHWTASGYTIHFPILHLQHHPHYHHRLIVRFLDGMYIAWRSTLKPPLLVAFIVAQPACIQLSLSPWVCVLWDAQSLPCKICQKVTLTVNRYLPSICFRPLLFKYFIGIPFKATCHVSCSPLLVLYVLLISRYLGTIIIITLGHSVHIKGRVFDYTHAFGKVSPELPFQPPDQSHFSISNHEAVVGHTHSSANACHS